MSYAAIRVDGLGKCYRIGAAAERYSTLGEALTHWVKAPMRNLRELRRMTRFDGDDGADMIWALRDVSFEVPHGEALGIVGRNGAGKSTLLKVLSRITDPTAGRADVVGRVGSLLEVGTGFHPELSGRDNVYLNGAILGMERRYIARMFDEIVDFAGVEPFIDTPVKKYSSGMRLRLAFAVAAHLEPEILIIDEVLAVGDAEFQRKCIGRMDAVARGGRTVLFVSHDLTLVQRLCSRCVLLEEGRLAGVGPTEEIIGQYLTSQPDQTVPERWNDVSALPRPGTGEAAVKGIWYSSGNPAVRGLPYTFGPLEIRLELEAAAAAKVDRVRVWLSSREGARLLVVDSLALAGATMLPEGRSVMTFTIRALNLNPGVYGLNVTVRNRRDTMFDRLEPAFQLEVIDLRGTRPDAGGWRGVAACDATVVVEPAAAVGGAA